MKFKTSLPGITAMAVAITGLSFLLISWNYSPDKYQFGKTHDKTDTLPPPKVNPETFNIDREINNAMQEVEKALKQIDASKIQAEIEKAMKDVDMVKLKAELDESLSKIDGNKIKADIEKALKEVDFDKINTQIRQSMDKVDMEKIKQNINMEKLKEEMKNLKKELEKLEPEIEKSMQKAKAELEKAGVELKEYKNFIEELEKDGLISKKEGYSLSHKDGELLINGLKQPKSVYRKYNSYLTKHKSFEINHKENNDGMRID
ncbi:MAG: hypothetical protein IPM85_15320 [Chitinophagaceae bacterium]|nr:hypothetical protein [Chitinophagaceae bacterium]